MTTAKTAPVEITGYSWVPGFARGFVRDIRVRWVLEEIGEPYRTRLYDPTVDGHDSRIPDQPFGQVPALVDGDCRLFESGAICLHLAERSPQLLPRDPAPRARALSWSIAALNSVEPAFMQYAGATIFERKQPWAEARLPYVEEMVRGRLARVSDALGDGEWLEPTGFSIGDLLMVSVLREVRDSDLLSDLPRLADYLARGTSRPAFLRAHAAQLADFKAHPEKDATP